MSWLSDLFGLSSKRPRFQPLPATEIRQSDTETADLQTDSIMRKYAKLHRATMLSTLTDINMRRRTLGA